MVESDDLELEVGPESRHECNCCGRDSYTTHGFITLRDAAYAVYYGGWGPAHPERGVTMAIAVGDWGDDATTADRVSIGLRARASGHHLTLEPLDPEESPWGRSDLLGEMLTAVSASESNVLDDVLALARFIATHDPRVARWLVAGS